MSSIYTVGGLVQASGGIYVLRRADEELLQLCREGSFAYVLSHRQCGKSSLMVRTATELSKEGVQSVIIDLTQIGTSTSSEQWYLGLLQIIEEQLLLDTEVELWWQQNADNQGPTYRLTRFFQEVLLNEIKAPVVIFVDEIDTTLRLNFTDDFFAAIRYLYQARAHKPDFYRLSFVLIGVANPSDLIQDAQRTPFNVGKRVNLTDFTFEEAIPLSAGIGISSGIDQKILRQVLSWTNGHPFLTQGILWAVADESRNNWSKSDINSLVRDTFLGVASERNTNLQFVRDMLTVRSPDVTEVLKIYRLILKGRKTILDEEQSLVKSHLKLSGVVCSKEGKLFVRNKIYREVFDEKWIKENTPIDRVRQLRQAATAAGLIFLLISFPLGVLAAIQWQEAERQKDIAQENAEIATLNADEARQQAEIARDSQQQAQLEADRARKSEIEAIEQAEIAEEQRARAQQQTRIAEEQRARTQQQTQIAEEQRDLATQREQESKVAARIAQERTSIARSRELAAQAIAVTNEFPQRSLLLALESLNVTKREGVSSSVGEEALRQILSSVGGQNLTNSIDTFVTYSVSPNNRWLVVVYRDGSIVKYDLSKSDPSLTATFLNSSEEGVSLSSFSAQAAISPNNKWLVVSGFPGEKTRLWDLTQKNPAASAQSLDGGKNFVFSSDSQWLATAGNDSLLWNLSSIDLAYEPIALPNHVQGVETLTFSPNNKWLIAVGDSSSSEESPASAITLWDLTNTLQPISNASNILDVQVTSVSVSPDSQWLTAKSEDGNLYLWNLGADGFSTRPIKLNGYEHGFRTAIFSPNSEWLITVGDRHQEDRSWDPNIRLWNMRNLDPLNPSFILPEHEDFVTPLEISSDSRWLITGSYGGATRLWDLTKSDPSSDPIFLRGHESRYVQTISFDETNSGPLGPLRGGGYDSVITTARFSPDNRWLATGGADATVRLWDLTAQDVESSSTVFVGHTEEISNIAFSSNNRWLVTGGGSNPNNSRPDNTVRIWDLNTSNPSNAPVVLRGHEDSIEELIFSSNNEQLISFDKKNTARLWNLSSGASGATPIVLETERATLGSLEISPNGHWIAAGASDDNAYIWNLADPNLVQNPIKLLGHRNSVNQVAFSSNNQWLVTSGGWDSSARLWNLKHHNIASKSINLYGGHQSIISDVLFSPDNYWLITGSWDGTIHLWNLDNFGPRSRPLVLSVQDGGIGELVVSPDSRWLAASNSGIKLEEDNYLFGGSNVYLWKIRSDDNIGAPIVLSTQQASIESLSISHDNSWLAGGDQDGNIYLWNLTRIDKSIDPIIFRGHEERIATLEFTPDGKWLVSGSSDRTARLWDLESSNQETNAIVLRGHEAAINSVAVSSDSNWLVTGSPDRTARIWDLTSPMPNITSVSLQEHEDAVIHVEISPDNRWVITGSGNGTIRVWPLNLDEVINLACLTSGRNLTASEWQQYFDGEEYQDTCLNISPSVFNFNAKSQEFTLEHLANFEREELVGNLMNSMHGNMREEYALPSNKNQDHYFPISAFPTYKKPRAKNVVLMQPQEKQDNSDFPNLRNYSHPVGAFAIDIPSNWIEIDRSSGSEYLVIFESPSGENRVSIDISAFSQVETRRLDESLEQSIVDLYGNNDNFSLLGEPFSSSNGNSILLGFEFDKDIYDTQTRMRGLSLIRQDGEQVSVLSFVSSVDSFDKVSDLALAIVNSYQIPAPAWFVFETYFHPNNLFFIEIPLEWNHTEQSREDETRVMFSSPNRENKVIVSIEKITELIDNKEFGEILMDRTQMLFQKSENFEIASEPSLSNNGNSLLLPFYLEQKVSDSTTQMFGISTIMHDGDFLTVISVVVPRGQFQASSSWILNTINSYVINSSILVP